MCVRCEALQDRAHGGQGGITHGCWRSVQPKLPSYYVGVVVYLEDIKIRIRLKVKGGKFTGLKVGQDVDSLANARPGVMLGRRLTKCPREG